MTQTIRRNEYWLHYSIFTINAIFWSSCVAISRVTDKHFCCVCRTNYSLVFESKITRIFLFCVQTHTFGSLLVCEIPANTTQSTQTAQNKQCMRSSDNCLTEWQQRWSILSIRYRFGRPEAEIDEGVAKRRVDWKIF